jgi:four helix bundle protein
MSVIQRFEDIEAWQLARNVTQRIYKLSSSGEFARDFGLKDQIRRSAVSIMSNIAEGFERDGIASSLTFSAWQKARAERLEHNSAWRLIKNSSPQPIFGL